MKFWSGNKRNPCGSAAGFAGETAAQPQIQVSDITVKHSFTANRAAEPQELGRYAQQIMKMFFGKTVLVTCLHLIAFAGGAFGQTDVRAGNGSGASAEIRSSAAYAEVLLRKTELQAETEGLAVEYTEEFPKLAEARFALEAIERERLRMLALKPAAASKLTTALGKLMVRKAEQEVHLWTLRKSLQEGHPDVKRAKRRVEIFEAAIKEILG